MSALSDLMTEEENALVRAILGHFFFVYIHPYMDGYGQGRPHEENHPQAYLLCFRLRPQPCLARGGDLRQPAGRGQQPPHHRQSG